MLQAEIELSDEDRDLDPFEDDLAVRGKGGRKTGGRQTGTADTVAAAVHLNQVWHFSCMTDAEHVTSRYKPDISMCTVMYFSSGRCSDIVPKPTCVMHM